VIEDRGLAWKLVLSIILRIRPRRKAPDYLDLEPLTNHSRLSPSQAEKPARSNRWARLSVDWAMR
jgi:hypothetical protein